MGNTEIIKNMLQPQRLMEIALQQNYSIKSSLRKRYSEVLVSRAVRFYIENQLDSSVVTEDLYNGDDFDCSCSQDDADKNKHQPSCWFIKNPYPNLIYSETEERKWQRGFTK